MTDYARIGVGYAERRVADPRIEAQLHAVLGGEARTVVNVGAGTGNYEPRDRFVVAVEPSLTMIEQRPLGSAPVVRATAEALPFETGSFDVAMGVLTVHHWRDRERGLRELARVARRIVLMYFEPNMQHVLWMYDYWPEIHLLPSERGATGEELFRRILRVESVTPVLVPADCSDHFGAAYWRRPEAYLDTELVQGMSSFAQLDEATFARGAARLRADLESGAWDERLGHLRALDECDLGYRIVSGSSRRDH